MEECQECGSKVTDDFARILSNGDGEILACQNCSPNSGIVQTAKKREERRDKNGEDTKSKSNSKVDFSEYEDLSYVDSD